MCTIKKHIPTVSLCLVICACLWSILSHKNAENQTVVLTCVQGKVLVKDGLLRIQGFGNKPVLKILEDTCTKKEEAI